MKYERLSTVMERQRHYRVLDTVAAAVLVLGIALAIVLAIGQIPGLSPLVAEPAAAPAQARADENPAQYTARVLADDERARRDMPETVRR
jgi:hypothetical protein